MTEEVQKENEAVVENTENTEQAAEEQTVQEEAPQEEVAEVKEEKKAEEPKPQTEEKKEVEVPKKFKSIVEEIEKMSVIDLNELVKVFEDKFGVSATAVAAAGPSSDAGSAEEKTDFDVELVDAGASKVGVIKAVKTVLGLGLKEAKDLVDAAPSSLKKGATKEEAEEMKKAVEEAGGKVEIK